MICKIRKNVPKLRVIIQPSITSLTKLFTRALCTQVKLNPDNSSNKVLNKGISKGLIINIASGGHTRPKFISGDSDMWKKAQKKPKNNIISETMNRINPNFSPDCTIMVWYPLKVLSVITSLYHLFTFLIMIRIASNKRSPLNSRGFRLVSTKAIPHIAKKAKKDSIKALLLLFTKWYKCFLLLFIQM
jgi:hypothetical protein